MSGNLISPLNVVYQPHVDVLPIHLKPGGHALARTPYIFVEWSGTGISIPMRVKIELTKPSVCRSASLNKDCSIAISSIARSLYFFEAPFRTVFSLLNHCSIMPSAIQNVRLPRCFRAASYCDQFPTRY